MALIKGWHILLDSSFPIFPSSFFSHCFLTVCWRLPTIGYSSCRFANDRAMGSVSALGLIEPSFTPYFCYLLLPTGVTSLTERAVFKTFGASATQVLSQLRLVQVKCPLVKSSSDSTPSLNSTALFVDFRIFSFLGTVWFQENCCYCTINENNMNGLGIMPLTQIKTKCGRRHKQFVHVRFVLFIWMYCSIICSILSHLLVHFQVQPLLFWQPAVYVCGCLCVCLLVGFYRAGRKKVVSS